MWEQIASNKRKSATLVFVMALLLAALGFLSPDERRVLRRLPSSLSSRANRDG